MILSRITHIAVAFVALAGIAQAASAPGPKAADAAKAYLVAINAHALDGLLAAMTEDVVIVAPNSAALEGKEHVATWAEAHFDGHEVRWWKNPLEFTVSGGLAVERYSYVAVNSPRSWGMPTVDTGNGIMIYHRIADGTWKLARDLWATDRPAKAAKAPFEAAAPCIDVIGPC